MPWMTYGLRDRHLGYCRLQSGHTSGMTGFSQFISESGDSIFDEFEAFACTSGEAIDEGRVLVEIRDALVRIEKQLGEKT